jgi:hypothetical protein
MPDEMNDEQIRAEHARLKAEVDALQREHDALVGAPDDTAGHIEHSAHLRRTIAELHAHMEHLIGHHRR